MPDKFSLLSNSDEPSDDQLKSVMADVLKEVIQNKKKADDALKLQMEKYKEVIFKKYHQLMLLHNG